jgi:hypothetical protein
MTPQQAFQNVLVLVQRLNELGKIPVSEWAGVMQTLDVLGPACGVQPQEPAKAEGES